MSCSSQKRRSPPKRLSRGYFLNSIPGQTQTLSLAIYAATQVPGGEATVAKLSLVSFTLAIAGLLLSEVIARRMRRLLGM